MQKLNISKNTYLVIYKLLHDALALVLGSFVLMLFAEGLLPGIVSSHISMARIVVLLIFILGSIVWIGHKFDIVYDAPKIRKNKIIPILILFSFLLIGNSMLKFALWQNILITLITLSFFFLLYKQIFSSE